jgi:cell wall-associated NlpC family hydrolase
MSNPIKPKSSKPAIIKTGLSPRNLISRIANPSGTKENLVDKVRNAATFLLVKNLLPTIVVSLILALLISFLFTVTKSYSEDAATAEASCLTIEGVSTVRAKISEMTDEEAKAQAIEALNNAIDSGGICAFGGENLPEGVSGGVYYDQNYLNNVIIGIKDYLSGKGNVPNIDSIVASVKTAIDKNKSEISVEETSSKKASVETELRKLYESGSSVKAKWSSIVEYLEKERGSVLWKGEIGNKIVAAAYEKVGLPYLFGARNNWDEKSMCYRGEWLNVFICGFDCSSLAGYAAAVGSDKDLSRNSSGRLAAGFPYSGTVSSLVGEAAKGTWAFIDSTEIAPGDLVAMSSPGEAYFHVAVYAGKDDKGKNLYIEAPKPGSDIKIGEAWWGGHSLVYVRPYETVKF